MKEIEEHLETTSTNGDAGGNSSNDPDRKRLVRIFLETWLEAKQQVISNGSGGGDLPNATTSVANETIHDAISRKLMAKGYNISSKLALNKTAGFFKKYQFVRRCEKEGKKIEWANYDIVKKIFEIGDTAEPTVSIPMSNIKSEEELTIVGEPPQTPSPPLQKPTKSVMVTSSTVTMEKTKCVGASEGMATAQTQSKPALVSSISIKAETVAKADCVELIKVPTAANTKKSNNET